jgi:hypothetical protein
VRLREDLLKKYGAPVERKGCDEDGSECHLILRTSGQTVEAQIALMHGVPLFAYVLYEPIAKKGI